MAAVVFHIEAGKGSIPTLQMPHPPKASIIPGAGGELVVMVETQVELVATDIVTLDIARVAVKVTSLSSKK